MVRPALGLALVLTSSIAHAQAPSEPAEGSAPQPPVVEPAPIVDSPDVEAAFQQALDALIARRFTEAADAFDRVARTTGDPARRAVAAEMAKQARLRAAALPPSITTTPLATVGRQGRYAFLTSTAILGLSLYGPALPFITDVDAERAWIGLYMLGAGGSFFGSYLATKDTTITWPMTDAWIHGASRGALHGFTLLALGRGSFEETYEPYDQNNPDSYEEETLQAEFGALALGSLAEGVTFALLANHYGLSTGETNAIAKGSDSGLFAGLGLAVALRGDAVSDRELAAGMLLGAGLGYGYGYFYSKHRDVTWGDSEALRAASMVSVLAASASLVIAETESDRAIATTLVAGGALGAVIGDFLLRDRDFSAGQGVIMEVSTLAGGLVGAGLGYLVSPDDTTSTMEKIVLTGAALGAAVGFAIPYAGLDVTTSTSGITNVQLVPAVSHEQRGMTLVGTF